MAGALDGQVAVVTGASRGIGRACALELARNGASVVVNYVSSEDLALSCAQEVKAAGSKALVV
jgi:NAD(P)-dependent dehydrogenase (short-subunit alcohol dehydrogenase family)